MPPLFNYGSEKKYMCTHEYALDYRMPYDLLTISGDPIPAELLHDNMFLRYQLNPFCPPHLPPPKGFEDDIYRNRRPYHREVFVETVPLAPSTCASGLSSAASLHGVCGVNVYTEASDIFADFPRAGDGLVLVYSTVPSNVQKLQRPFDESGEGPSLIVDDVFVSWDSLGLVSLNELSAVNMAHNDDVRDNVHDCRAR